MLIILSIVTLHCFLDCICAERPAGEAGRAGRAGEACRAGEAGKAEVNGKCLTSTHRNDYKKFSEF